MATRNPATRSPASGQAAAFAPLGARRLLVLGGIGLILVGMILGDIFAVFVLHQNAARVGITLAAATQAALAGDASSVFSHFQKIGGFLENRGTKVDTHAHMIAFGYLALMIAAVLPWMALSATAKKRLAVLFLIGAAVLPLCVFLIHYVGLAYSPLQAIGWASIFADFGGLLVIVATVGYLWGLWKHFSNPTGAAVQDELLGDRSVHARLLLSGGVLLVLAGFVHGAYYAAMDLYNHEAWDYSILSDMSAGAANRAEFAVNKALNDHGQLLGDKAVKIAAHAHIIEFGLLAILLAFFQPYVDLNDAWKRRWAATLLAGSAMLPICVLLEIRYGLLAGGLADIGGLLVILALLAMWIGVLRYTGRVDSAAGGGAVKSLSGSRKLLLIGGLALAIWGMGYGLWYAVFAEHQDLDRIGASLATSFAKAAERDLPGAQSALHRYRETKYVYERRVDVHGHWIGLAMLAIVLGIAFDRVGFAERQRFLLALGLLAGSALFPLGVLLQTWSHGPVPRGIAIAGSALVILSLAGVTLGLARGRTSS